jgi:alpha-tubulin suppressor-like RCC1 family protein
MDTNQTIIPDFGGIKVTQISAGGDQSVVLLEDGIGIAFGIDYEKRSGLDGTPCITTITTKPNFGAKKVTQISSGRAHWLVLLEDGTVSGWGKNDENQVSIPNFSLPPPPLPPPPPPPLYVRQIDFKIPDLYTPDELTLPYYKAFKQSIECPQCRVNIKKVILNCNHAFCETCASTLTNCPTCISFIFNKTIFHQKYYKNY